MPSTLIPNVLAALLLSASAAAATERATVAAVDVEKTAFIVTLTDGSVLKGPQLAGAVITVALPGGGQAEIRIDSVESDPADPDITLYGLSGRDPATGNWANLCLADPKGVAKGFPMRGALGADSEYHPDAPGFSLTCVAGVQAKCVRWGYKPWIEMSGGVPMIDLYRTCMRMARADYCGDGIGATRNGTVIDLYDIAGIQRPETEAPMPFEAAWTPKGAICVRHTRLPDVVDLEKLVARCPRLAGAVGETCSENAPGALLFNRSAGISR
jgi:hypothetical protein